MTALQQGEGVRLLTDEAAADHAGVPVETIWGWESRGFITPVPTPCGPRFALHEIRGVLEDGRDLVARRNYLKAGQAASRLGVNIRTLAAKADEGRLDVLRGPDGKRLYATAGIRAIEARRAEPGFSQWWPEPRTD